MDVVIDGMNTVIPTQGLTTFQDLFDSLRKTLGVQRRVIVWMKLDDAELSGAQQGTLSGQALSPAARLEVGTADRVGLAVRTLGDLMPHLSALEKAHLEAAEQVIAANYRDAMGKFKDCFEGWANLVSTLRSVSSIAAIDLGTLQSAQGPVDSELRKIQDALLRFKVAFQQSDVVRLGDIAQYDLKPLLEVCRGILEALRRHLLESGSPPR